MALVEPQTGSLTNLVTSYNLPRFPQWAYMHIPQAFPKGKGKGRHSEAEVRRRLESVDLTAVRPGLLRSKDIDSSTSSGLWYQGSGKDEVSFLEIKVQQPEINPNSLTASDIGTGTFHKWIKSLRRRAARRSALHQDLWKIATSRSKAQRRHKKQSSRSSNRRHSTSESSFRFVSAVRSASVSLLSVSHTAGSLRTPRQSHHKSNTDHSSGASLAAQRTSEDSIVPQERCNSGGPARRRALQRRRILEELIETEEGYISDVRFLMNVYVTILASLPTLPSGLRSSIHQNLTEMVLLHEEILGELHSVVPYSEYTQPRHSLEEARSVRAQYDGSQRSQAGRDPGMTGNVYDEPSMFAEAQTAAEVARVFIKRMHRFFIYREYGTKYEMLIRDVASAHNSLPDWDSYQRGLETLASIFGPSKSEEIQSKKSLTISDLLVKPVQRVCKYPLIFSELLKNTPAEDCPNSQMQIHAASVRFREVNSNINGATDDSVMKATLEKTWLLQDRLVFPDCGIDAASKNRVRSYGHVQLCGALHACWQGPNGVEGRYFICLLYQHVLCLASTSEIEPVYTLQACISLDAAKLEDVDNGQGRLQCHTALHSWKLIFECDCQLYEIILTACSTTEEREWRRRLGHLGQNSELEKGENLQAFLHLDVKSLGTVFGNPGTMARKISIQRATTIGSKSPFCQVVLRNTSTTRDHDKKNFRKISRSQSLLTTNAKVPVLAPARNERARIEAGMADVWSREVLPFPAMLARLKSEHLVRTSATQVMRKLSVSNFASSMKRTSSVSSKHPGDIGQQSSSHVEGPWYSSVPDERARKQVRVETLHSRSLKEPELFSLLEYGSSSSDGVGVAVTRREDLSPDIPPEQSTTGLKRSSISRLRRPFLTTLKLSESTHSLQAILEGKDEDDIGIARSDVFSGNWGHAKPRNHSLFRFFR